MLGIWFVLVLSNIFIGHEIEIKISRQNVLFSLPTNTIIHHENVNSKEKIQYFNFLCFLG